MNPKRAKLEMVDTSATAEHRRVGASSDQGASTPPIVHFMLSSIRRRLRTIAQITVAGVLLTLCYLMLVTPQFTATATLLLDTRQKKIFNTDLVLPGLDSDIYNIESQLEILRSDRIASRVLAALDPAEVAAVARSQKLPAVAPQSVGGADGRKTASEPTKQLVLDIFNRKLKVGRKGRSYVIEVAFTDVSAERAAKIANLYVDAFIKDQVDAKVQATRSANQWLEERLTELSRDVEEAEKRLQHYRAKNELVDVGDRTLVQKEISDYAQQLMTARARAAEAEARLTQVRSLAGQTNQLQALEAALQSTVIGDFRRQQGQIQRRIGELVSRFGSQHPSVVNAQAELDTLNKEIEREIKRIVDASERTYEALNEQIRLLEEGYAELKGHAMKRGEHQIRLNALLRDVEASSSLFSNLQRRFKETQAQEKLQTADARVVAYALAPDGPSYPKRPLTLAMAGLLWMFLATGLAIVHDFRRRRYFSPVDVEISLRLPCVAKFDLPHDNGEAAEIVDISRAPPSVGAASYSLKSWVDRAGGERAKIVLMLSATMEEGRSYVGYHLARHAVESGVSTLLIDSDISGGVLSKVLDSAGELPSLQTCLARPKTIIGRLRESALHFCPASQQDNVRPIDVLSSRNMKAFLKSARDRFDLIVIDGASMGSRNDAVALLQQVDAVVVVARAGVSEHDAVADVVRQAERAEVPAIGIAMTMVAQEGAEGSSSATRGYGTILNFDWLQQKAAKLRARAGV